MWRERTGRALIHTAGTRMVASQHRGRMDDSAQQRLFAETPGSIEPPEENLYLGTSGWSYADWEGTLYPEGLPSGSRLAEYAKHFATVEIDSTFYGTPRRSTVQNWREVVPEGFLFAAKFPQEVTHERNLVGSEAEAESFVRTMAELGDRLGPLLLQLPPSFTVEGMGVLEDFLSTLPQGPRYAVEVRHSSWLGSDLSALLRERGAALRHSTTPSRTTSIRCQPQSRSTPPSWSTYVSGSTGGACMATKAIERSMVRRSRRMIGRKRA